MAGLGTSDPQAALNDAYVNAKALVADATAALDRAMSLLSPVHAAAPKGVVMPPPLTRMEVPDAPILEQINIGDIPEIPKPPKFATISPFNPGVPFPTPSFGKEPRVTDPRITPLEIDDFRDRAPLVSIPAAPPPPNPFAGSAPSLTQITIPNAPQIQQPAFNGIAPDAPDIDSNAIANTFMPTVNNISQMMRANVESDVDRLILKMNPRYNEMLETLESKLKEYTSGTVATGLDQSVENAIYERSKTKVDAETRRVQAEAWSGAAKRGFTLPPGALMAALQSSRQSGADNNAQSAREIVVMQAEMAQKNIQFAINASAELRKTIVQAAISANANAVQMYGQAAQQASQFVDSLVKAAGVAVDAFKAKLEIYKAEASVYETLIRASLAEVDIYKAQIEGEKAKSDVNMALVKEYEAQISAHASMVDAYSKSVDAIATIANVEKLKVESFVATVQAYSARTQAASASYEAIKAAWGGEESKVRAYQASVQAYSAQVDGYKAAAQAEAARIDGESSIIRTEYDAYSAQVNAIKGIADAESSRASAEINAQNSLVNAYSVGSQAVIANAQAEAERYKTEAQVTIENARLQYQNLIDYAKVEQAALQGTAEIAVSAGKAYADVAQSAMSGVTTLVSLGEETTTALGSSSGP